MSHLQMTIFRDYSQDKFEENFPALPCKAKATVQEVAAAVSNGKKNDKIINVNQASSTKAIVTGDAEKEKKKTASHVDVASISKVQKEKEVKTTEILFEKNPLNDSVEYFALTGDEEIDFPALPSKIQPALENENCTVTKTDKPVVDRPETSQLIIERSEAIIASATDLLVNGPIIEKCRLTGNTDMDFPELKRVAKKHTSDSQRTSKKVAIKSQMVLNAPRKIVEVAIEIVPVIEKVHFRRKTLASYASDIDLDDF